jgi:hypothetical protein
MPMSNGSVIQTAFMSTPIRRATAPAALMYSPTLWKRRMSFGYSLSLYAHLALAPAIPRVTPTKSRSTPRKRSDAESDSTTGG